MTDLEMAKAEALAAVAEAAMAAERAKAAAVEAVERAVERAAKWADARAKAKAEGKAERDEAIGVIRDLYGLLRKPTQAKFRATERTYTRIKEDVDNAWADWLSNRVPADWLE